MNRKGYGKFGRSLVRDLLPGRREKNREVDREDKGRGRQATVGLSAISSYLTDARATTLGRAGGMCDGVPAHVIVEASPLPPYFENPWSRRKITCCRNFRSLRCQSLSSCFTEGRREQYIRPNVQRQPTSRTSTDIAKFSNMLRQPRTSHLEWEQNNTKRSRHTVRLHCFSHQPSPIGVQNWQARSLRHDHEATFHGS